MTTAYEQVPLSKLKPMPGNPRRNEAAIGPVAESIKRFGWTNPILARRKDRVVVAGHTRLEAAKRLGLKTAPVLWLDMSETDAKLYNLADNKLGQIAEWDVGPLAELLRSLQAEDAAGLAIAGFGEDEIAALLAEATKTDGQTDPDDVPETPKAKDVYVKPGELYRLGEHRLLCGDSTKAEDVARLMDGKKARLMATDPPYGVGYGDETGSASKFGTIANDENDGPRLQRFLESVFRAWQPMVADDAAWYLWHAQMTQGFFAAAAAAVQLLIHRQIIWVKPSLVLGHGDYHWRHELCFYGWREGHRCRWLSDRSQTTVWEIGRENDHIHPTQKPVELFSRPMEFNTTPGDAVAEPFCGSGSQLIAAEQTGRRCFAMELEPAYVQVAIERWEKFSGRKAERVKP